MERMVGEWCLGMPIGSGSFAIVWKAKHKVTGQESAIKEIALDKLNAKLRQSLESEVSILKRINHDNIVKLLEVFEEKSKLYLVMEYCAGGDLAHYIRAHKRVPEAVAQHFMQQLAAGLREMWSHHLVHRDLKPQNLLLAGPGPTAVLKIADFGFARNLQPQGLAETLCGSPLYMAPEILHFHKYDAKADLWSVGAILFELVAGRPPFNGANQFQLLRNIERGEARLPDVVASQLSLPCKQLIHALLRRNPVERISFEEFFRHPFLRGPVAPAPAAPSPFGAALPPLGRSASASSIPQQVLGFKQQGPAPQGTSCAEGGTGAAAGGGGCGPPAVVPPGGLSNQLKQRRSLDLDGAAQRGGQPQPGLGGPVDSPGRAHVPTAQAPLAAGTLAAQLAGLAGQQGGVLGQQQQPPQQQLLLGNGWGQCRQPEEEQQLATLVPGGHVGSLGRHAGQQMPMHRAGFEAGRPTAHLAPYGTSAPAAAHPLLHGQAPPRPPPGPSPRPSYAPAYPPTPPPAPAAQQHALAGLEPAMTPTPRAAAAAPPPATAPAPAPGGPSGSSHSLDEDDYVLVDTSLLSSKSLHQQQQQQQQQESAPSPAPPESPASGGDSLVNSLQGRPVDEVFTVRAGDDPAGAGAEATAAASPVWLATGESEGEEPAVLRWQLLRRAAHAMEVLAGPQPEQLPGQCLSLCLAALQLLEHALDSLAAGAAQAGSGEQGAAADVGGGPAAAAVAKAEAKLQCDILRLLERAQAAAAALARLEQGAGGAAAPGGALPEALPLPDPWELCYHLSLGLAKEAAVDELLGNQERSLQLYSKACSLLHFLCTEGPGLQLDPPLQLTQQDHLRLQRYAAATSARWAACKAQLGAENAGAA